MSAAKPDASYGAAMRQAAKGVAQRGTEIPAKYANPATSGTLGGSHQAGRTSVTSTSSHESR